MDWTAPQASQHRVGGAVERQLRNAAHLELPECRHEQLHSAAARGEGKKVGGRGGGAD